MMYMNNLSITELFRFSYLTAYTGKKIKDYEDINEIYNVLYIETLYNFTLPNWTQSVYPNKLKEPSCYR